jgi:tetratricopeptide (TPR) repeat protein
VFYYYFDKVRSRFRHSDELEEVVVDSELEKKANDGIAQQYYEKAVAMGDKSSEVFYNLGRLYYVRGLHNKALEMWLNLYDDFIARPELMIALGNAFFRMNNLESSKGEYLRLISVLERETEEIQAPNPRKTEHLKLYHTLSSAYNNLGAIYQLQGNEVKSNLCYWRSIEYSKQLEKENEYARVNMARSFRERREAVMPLLDDEIPFSMDVYRADMR